MAAWESPTVRVKGSMEGRVGAAEPLVLVASIESNAGDRVGGALPPCAIPLLAALGWGVGSGCEGAPLFGS